ncbi:MAG: DapH/DapD/GlmU-related protein [Candidatus Tritonobacter lacicola]|nr:DapH/DapD/GlmU-related protein [Candidatus Tritonobacter lacicola]
MIKGIKKDTPIRERFEIVTRYMIRRAIKFSGKTGRAIRISKTSGGEGVSVFTLDGRTEEGRRNLEEFLRVRKRHYTFSGLGKPEEKNSINWRVLAAPWPKRVINFLGVGLSLLYKGVPSKNVLYRKLGFRIGRNTEIMQFVWLDHFMPELIEIGDNCLIGAYSTIATHAYEGHGRFRFGPVRIGNNCTLAAGTGMLMIEVEDNVRTLPGTALSPYFLKVKKNSVVGYQKPPVVVDEQQ